MESRTRDEFTTQLNSQVSSKGNVCNCASSKAAVARGTVISIVTTPVSWQCVLCCGDRSSQRIRQQLNSQVMRFNAFAMAFCILSADLIMDV